MGILQVFRLKLRKFRILEILNFHPCFIFQIGYRPGSKNTAAALKYARKRMFVERYGDRDFAKNYVIMLTGDEPSTDPFAAATEACRLQVCSSISF